LTEEDTDDELKFEGYVLMTSSVLNGTAVQEFCLGCSEEVRVLVQGLRIWY